MGSDFNLQTRLEKRTTLTDSSGGTVSNSIASVLGAIVSVTTVVDSSGGGTAQTTNLALIPAKSILLNVQAEVTIAMDGDATTTLEVGVSGNIDAYIDTTDFDPSDTVGVVAGSAAGTTNDIKTVQYLGAATQLIATWTNDASAAAGSTTITAQYLVVGESTADAALTNDAIASLSSKINELV